MKHSSRNDVVCWPPLGWSVAALCLLLLLVNGAMANNQAVPLAPRVDLGPSFLLFEDAGGQLDVAQVMALDASQWRRFNAATINLGFVDAAVWLHVAVHNAGDQAQSLLLEQHYALMDDMQVYWRCDSGIVQEYHAGDLKPWSDRPVLHHAFVFPLQADAGDLCQLWLRAKNTEAMELPLVLWNKDTFYEQERNVLLIDGMFLGFFAIMALYNALLYLNVRDASYFYYTIFVASMFLFFASQQGYLYEWILSDWPRWHHYFVPFNLGMSVLSGSMFFFKFLDLKQHAPRLASVVMVFMWILLFSPFSTFVMDYSVSIAGIIVCAAVASLFGFSAAVYLAFQNVRSAQILLAGWLVLVVCVVFQTLSKLGAVHNDFVAEYGMRLGTALEIVIFSLALSYRINEERRAKEAALLAAQTERIEKLQAQDIALAREREAREIKEQALEQQRRVNEKLEFMVHERTHELEDALTELERANRELQALSVKDALTNVFNRRFFNQKITEEWARTVRHQRPFALLMVDLDKFKGINDTYGHVCGDHVLIKVAALLKTVVCRPGDTISRYGGEEFAILLPETGMEGAEKVADLLVQRVAGETITFNSVPIPVTISIGLAVFNCSAPDTDIQSFIERADKALYHAKESGRNRYSISTN